MRFDASSATEIVTSPEKLQLGFVSETGCEAYPDWQDNFIRIRDQELRRGCPVFRDSRWGREPCEAACALRLNPPPSRDRDGRRKSPCGQTRTPGVCHCSKRTLCSVASLRRASAARGCDPLRTLPDPCQEWTLTGPGTVVHASNRRFPYLLGAA